MYEELADIPLMQISPCTTMPAANSNTKLSRTSPFLKIQLLYENTTYRLREMPMLSSANFFQHHYEGTKHIEKKMISIINNISIDV